MSFPMVTQILPLRDACHLDRPLEMPRTLFRQFVDFISTRAFIWDGRNMAATDARHMAAAVRNAIRRPDERFGFLQDEKTRGRLEDLLSLAEQGRGLSIREFPTK